MVIGFKKEFVPKILNGTKEHTIREDLHDRWKVGMKMHMATGVRTKEYNQFDEKICTGIQTFRVIWKDSPEDSLLGRSVRVFIDGKNVTDSFFDDDNTVLEVLAKKDGFDSVNKFFQWFSTDFKGKIIHWTDLKY